MFRFFTYFGSDMTGSLHTLGGWGGMTGIYDGGKKPTMCWGSWGGARSGDMTGNGDGVP